MSEREKGALLEKISALPEKDKQFILGYAAGRTADVKPSTEEAEDENEKKEE